MKFMVFVKANKESEAGVMPSQEQLEEMGKFNEELVKAGIMLDGQGLHPSSRSVRIRYGKDPAVIDGAYSQVSGFWLLQCRSKEECIEWIARAPFRNGEEVEIRQLFDISDFDMTDAQKKRYDDLSAQLGKN